MAELLIRVHDNVNAGDFYRDCALTKRGDVIVVAEDGHVWGLRELDNPDWRIVKLPGLPVAQASTLLLPEKDADSANPSRTLRPRASGLDLDHASIPAGLAAYLADGSRAAQSFTVAARNGTCTQAARDFLALKRAKAPIADPNILGNATPNVIG